MDAAIYHAPVQICAINSEQPTDLSLKGKSSPESP